MIWRCILCESSSIGTAVKRASRNAAYCDWCAGELARTGRAWCGRGRHVVKQEEMAAGKGRCKACERARTKKYEQSRAGYAKAWRAANREHTLAYGVAYRERNRERLRLVRRARYWNEPERWRAIFRARHAQHAEQRRAWRKAQYWSRPEWERSEARRRAIQRKLAILRGMR